MSAVLKQPEVLVLEDWSDPLWRLENIYWVLNDKGQEVPFQLRAEQREFLQSIRSRNLVLKARQIGFTTAISLLQLDQCLFNRNFKAATIADTLQNAQEIFRTKIEFPFMRLPKDLRKSIGVATDSKTEYIFGNGSSISVTTTLRPRNVRVASAYAAGVPIATIRTSAVAVV